MTLVGRYSFVPNPCTTTPCLPGMALAVSVDGSSCFLAVDGELVCETRAWHGYLPRVDDVVRVTGARSERLDVFGNPYCIIEVDTILPVQ